MTKNCNAAGLAALSICEAILLTLIEEDLVDRDKVQELLEDALEGHLASSSDDADSAEHARAAVLIEEIVISLNAADRRDGRAESRLSRKLTALGPRDR